MRSIERMFFNCPEIDIHSIPIIDEKNMKMMKKITNSDRNTARVYFFVKIDSNKEPYVDIYIWNNERYARFVLKEGWTLQYKDEEVFHEYTALKELSIMEYNYKVAVENIRKCFPKWNFQEFQSMYVGEILEYLYYVSHKGVREKFYKANLINIGKRLDEFPEYNMIGNTPSEIIGHGVTMNFLRIIDKSEWLLDLICNGKIDECVSIYKKYAGYIDKIPTAMQWKYLQELHDNDGMLWGRSFNRTIYRYIKDRTELEIFDLYKKYFELKDMLQDVCKTKIPKPSDLESTIKELQFYLNYKENKAKYDVLIHKRYFFESGYYEYTDGIYMVCMPRSSTDIFLEGNYQENCVLRYLEDHAYGATTILFLRKIQERNQSYVTIEIKNSCINQVFGKSNNLPKCDVYEFLEEYSCRKDFYYNPEALILDYLDEHSIDLYSYLEKYENKYNSKTEEQEDFNQLLLIDLFPNVFEDYEGR